MGPEDVAAARERSGGVDHRTGEPLRAEGPNGQRQWHMKWDPEAREWVAENPGAGHTDPAGSKAAGRSSIGSFAIPDDAVRIKSGGKGGWEHQLYAPEPNKTYLVDDKFAYVTDDQGRVKEAHGVLEDAPRDAAGHRQTKAGGVDRLPGDEGVTSSARVWVGLVRTSTCWRCPGMRTGVSTRSWRVSGGAC